MTVTLTQPSEEIALRYRPRTLVAGLCVFIATLLAIFLGASEALRSLVMGPFARRFAPLRRWVVP
jgi:hypothetical protein